MNAKMNRHNMAYLKEETPTKNIFLMFLILMYFMLTKAAFI